MRLVDDLTGRVLAITSMQQLSSCGIDLQYLIGSFVITHIKFEKYIIDIVFLPRLTSMQTTRDSVLGKTAEDYYKRVMILPFWIEIGRKIH